MASSSRCLIVSGGAMATPSLTGRTMMPRSRVAFVSFSTFGYPRSERAEKMMLAPRVLEARGADFEYEGEMTVDVVVDLVAGAQWPSLIACLKRGGRYVTAGAIGGPICELDLRTLYLNDLTLAGCTFQPKSVFENLVGYIERGEIRPVVSKAYRFSQVAEAQTDFIAKRYPGKLVMVPDRLVAPASEQEGE